ncbi:MOSC domain-containing protein [Streptomyces litchfieldiae]|uniref:MOSC N-terminal beta barrel domain-containing protein n=1 Tax=Streptomyces litchfieldiae TaxID=3075543 RepID=A0ABU2MSC9_9ACTN|nr:MOSC N-terminal beta barrel domain-containing protein [Streptomyces sp. DSM 44938]MDT0344539.1 MOSC N-terminal beta barrel domain-containing protein [Streptomyces sp. DSM 44938]
MAKIKELYSYPVKGCAGMALGTALMTAAGLAYDRAFMVVDAEGTFRSQRRDPRLALIRPEIDAGGELLTLRGPDAAGAVDVPVVVDDERRDLRLFGKPFTGIDQGEDAAAWLTALLGAPSRLVGVPPDHARVTDGETPGTCGYADSGALHLTTTASLDHLNERITAAGRAPVPMARFRPNVVAAGPGLEEPHAEDRLRRLTVGAAELAYAKPAIRCAVTLVDQESGDRAGPEPLRTLATYRRHPGGGVAFGVKFSVPRGGKLSVGDELTVTARA